MAVSALVFSGANGLDFCDLRMSVVRIPEVMGRIREAQKILDGLDFPKTDFLNAICSSDESFERNPRLKKLAVAVVQVGLYDRYLKTQKKPDYFVGTTGADSAANVASGQMTFAELVLNSPGVESLKTNERILTLVTALTSATDAFENERFALIGAKKDESADQPATKLLAVNEHFSELKQMVLSLNEEMGVTRFIHVGPAGGLKSFDYNQMGNDEIEALDSIELDPMLGWFWRANRGSLNDNRALAN